MDKGKKTMIKASNTCPVDTVLQMLYCMWAQKKIPHQIIEYCEPILSTSLSLIKEGNHAYARVLFINDASERCTEKSDRFVKKRISKINNGSHYETWDCCGDLLWYTQDINELFLSGEFLRMCGECELGPKCRNHPNHVKDSLKKNKDRFLLPADFPISGLQNAINRLLFEKECKQSNLDSSSSHFGTRAVN